MTDGKKNARWDLTKFDNMETAVLESFLREDVDAPEAEQLDIEVIRYIANILAERQKADQAEIAADVAAAKAEFYELYYPLAEKGETLYDFAADDEPRSKPRRFWTRTWRQLAGIAAMFVFLVFCGTFRAYALGYDPLAFVADWCSRSEQSLVTAELIETMAEYSEADLVPKWLPDGYSLGRIKLNGYRSSYSPLVEVNAFKIEHIIYIAYTDHGDERGAYISAIKPIEMIYDKDFAKIAKYTLQDVTYYIMGTDDRRVITWQNGKFAGTIVGQLNLDEALKIINSIPEPAE